MEHSKPNPITIAAIEEVQQMKSDFSIGKSYDNVEEMINDLTREEKNEKE